MEPDAEIITINDIRKAGHCVAGARSWFSLHGLDFRLFLKEGLPAGTLLATGDQLAVDVVTKKRERCVHG